ncbi:TPA: hypothetical protein ACJEU7_001495 [Acinetobacter baumannii]|uniref:hypothetical protein n=1 Tax=Acinetobacter baumannii TaxID=470 RepID=UPI00124ABD32|nr:hypothetical protein [Acinetobacter baumannii]KAB1665082.1 hypothetical protein F8B05_19235 [Acinetobacter baumannii]MCX3035282.1 hypothetical protein [Acinetobacter baumannii]
MNFLPLTGEFYLSTYTLMVFLSGILIKFLLLFIVLLFVKLLVKNGFSIKLMPINGRAIYNFFKQPVLLLTLLLVLFTLTAKLSIANRSVGTDKWLNLAQAESMLIQLQTNSNIEKKPLSFDRQKSDNWIKTMREKASSGNITYSEYYALAVDYNDLNIGLDDVKTWFKTNSTDTIRSQLEKGLEEMMQRNQQQGQQQPQGIQEQPQDSSTDTDKAMEAKLMKAFS